MKHKGRLVEIGLMLCMLLSLLVGCGSAAAGEGENAAELAAAEETNWTSSIKITINPEICIYLDENQMVVAAEGINDDGKQVLEQVDLVGKTVEEGVVSFSEEAWKQGYVEESCQITIAIDELKENAEVDTVHEAASKAQNDVYAYMNETMNIQPSVILVDETGQEQPYICPTCEGTNRVMCETCEGLHSIDCTICGGQHQLVCERCEGDGLMECSKCHGSGLRQLVDDPNCEHCHGSGICKNCGGEGKTYAYGGAGTDHENVVVGWEWCFACDGSGRCCNCDSTRTGNCDLCVVWNDNGVEVHNPYGVGIIPCDICSEERTVQGSGYIECTICNEGGRILCPDCEDGTHPCPDCSPR